MNATGRSISPHGGCRKAKKAAQPNYEFCPMAQKRGAPRLPHLLGRERVLQRPAPLGRYEIDVPRPAPLRSFTSIMPGRRAPADPRRTRTTRPKSSRHTMPRLRTAHRRDEQSVGTHSLMAGGPGRTRAPSTGALSTRPRLDVAPI